MGAPANVDKWRGRLYGDWINVARTHADFIGIQTYTRFRVNENGIVSPPKGALKTFKRTPKPSARHLGNIARANGR